MPLVSVIVPVYNVEKYLHACLDSILEQTFTDFELILVDDGSYDSSGKICDEYAKKDSRIRVFHQENQGQAAARNFGVTQAKSEWIHFVDSDDVIHNQMVEILYQNAIKYGVKISMALLKSSNELDFEDLNSQILDTSSSIIEVNEKNLIEMFKDLRYHSVCAKLIDKKILLEFPFENGRIHEDSPVICKWFYNAKKIAYSPNVLYVFNENPTSTTRNTFNKKRLDLMWAWEQQELFYEKLNFLSMKKAIEIRHIYTASILYSKMKNHPNFRKKAAQFRCKILKEYYHTLKYPEFSKKDKLFVFENFFPIPLTIYWIIVNRFFRKK